MVCAGGVSSGLSANHLWLIVCGFFFSSLLWHVPFSLKRVAWVPLSNVQDILVAWKRRMEKELGDIMFTFCSLLDYLEA